MRMIDELLPHVGPLTSEQAGGWIAACLAEYQALRQYDDHLYPPGGDAAGLATARRLHSALDAWATEAEALRTRVRQVLAEGAAPPVVRADELDRAIGRTRATLRLTPERVIHSREQLARGETVGMEEVRRSHREAKRRAGFASGRIYPRVRDQYAPRSAGGPA